jgi:hypothetical protein
MQTLEKTIEEVGLEQHNMSVLHAMQIWYLDSWEMLQHCQQSRYDAMTYYLGCLHGAPRQYQLHLNFHRGKK